MKKLFNVFLFLCVATFAFAMTTTKVHADEEVKTSTLTIHYASMTKNYTDAGMHAWGFGSNETKTFPYAFTETDDFGAKITLTVDSNAADTIGLIPLDKGMADGTQWDNKGSKDGVDIKFPTNLLSAKGGEYDSLDVYMFHGASNYVIAYPDRGNIMVGYYDPSGEYEEHLGLHVWGKYTTAEYVTKDGEIVTTDISAGSQWGTPTEVLVDAMTSEGGTAGKLIMLYSEPGESVGGLIYAGDDATKKYPSGDPWNLPVEAGKLHCAFVSNKTLYNDAPSFLENAFAFRIKGFGTDEKGNFTGTYAPNPTSIIVAFDAAVGYPAVGEGEDLATKLAARFTINEVTVDGETYTKGALVTIKQVDFNKTVASTSEFVIQLDEESKLDNTKHYVLTYSEKEEADTEAEKDNKNYAEIEIDLDREAPTIVVGATREIPYGKQFSFDLMPSITVTDNRDAEVLYYCVEGQESKLDTGKAGEQKVKIFATDAWGNTAEAYITFTVASPAASGCGKGAVVVAVSAMIAASAAFVLLRKRNA